VILIKAFSMPKTGLILCTELVQLLKEIERKNNVNLEGLILRVRKLHKKIGQTDAAAKRQLTDLRIRHRAELDLLRTELLSELVDREANSARVADRQRFLFERSLAQTGQFSSNERAFASAAYVEKALTSLCPNPHRVSDGCDKLAARERERGGETVTHSCP
jgi:hypothetical protein